ncbi:ankyrin repeat domain-containing protein [bacterium]|nr:MAG: ankyrin repeat domain-containing protein [bacterium]
MNKKFISSLFLVCHAATSSVFAMAQNNELFEAARTGNAQQLRIFLVNDVNVNEKDARGQTPLHYACLGGHVECVKILIENSANINEKNQVGYAPLHIASSYGHVGCMRELLVSGANPNEKVGARGNTPLHLAILRRHLSLNCLTTLLENGANINEKMTWDGGTALHEASETGCADYVVMLIENGANVNELNKCGQTPAHKAKSRGYQNIVEILESYADFPDIKSADVFEEADSKKRKRDDDDNQDSESKRIKLDDTPNSSSSSGSTSRA